MKRLLFSNPMEIQEIPSCHHHVWIISVTNRFHNQW
jgi:hypothetical protein